MAAERQRQGATARNEKGATDRSDLVRTAIGYVRVSTDMQASEGVSLEAQQGAIRQYCELHGLRLLGIHQDVLSGGKSQRPGLADALSRLRRDADVLVVVKFDRLSRSIRHFCEIYETYFRDGAKELVAIREAIRLDSALGRALISILLVFAQMEREAVGERTREAIQHIRRSGYHFGKVPYGKRAVRAPDNSRMKVLVDDEKQQAVIAQIQAWVEAGDATGEIAKRLNVAGVVPPQAKRWTKHTIYSLRLRLSQLQPRPHNERPHSDEDVKEEMLRLRSRGHTHAQIATILNELGFIPLKGGGFTERSVRKLFRYCRETQVLSPRRFLEAMFERMQHEHAAAGHDEPFQRPGCPTLAKVLTDAGYVTPKGHARWWPAQVQQLLDGRFERYYSRAARSVANTNGR
ncbi:MAG TPA: recombinase family protein [Pseudomonadota bacterium]|nr:recombinase family protein [Pseudomonadota bacterium]